MIDRGVRCRDEGWGHRNRNRRRSSGILFQGKV